MSAQFIEVQATTDQVRREKIIIGTSSILMVKDEGGKCRVVLNDAKKTEFIIPGTTYEEMKKKLGVS